MPLLANWKCIYSSELAPALSFPSLLIKKIGCEHLALPVHLWGKKPEKKGKKKNPHWSGFVLIKRHNVFEVPKFNSTASAGVTGAEQAKGVCDVTLFKISKFNWKWSLFVLLSSLLIPFQMRKMGEHFHDRFSNGIMSLPPPPLPPSPFACNSTIC